MREATVSRKQVKCPNASMLAYGKHIARVGDWVTWRDSSGTEHTGRMIGRIDYAPPLADGTPAIKGWIEALTLCMEMTHATIRWIDPASVTQVHANAPDIARFLAFFSGKLPSRDWLAGAYEYGSLRANQDPDRPQWDFENSRARFNEYRARNGRTVE